MEGKKFHLIILAILLFINLYSFGQWDFTLTSSYLEIIDDIKEPSLSILWSSVAIAFYLYTLLVIARKKNTHALVSNSSLLPLYIINIALVSPIITLVIKVALFGAFLRL
ncbi:MAG: hypothetical protein O2794_01365 [bacterium]|nr:hypothetical protein [bacterium]